jgi:NitT/TauT family transport system substrate-binding protein
MSRRDCLHLGLIPLALATSGAESATIRVGHFPNVTHVQALVARSMARAGQGWFEARLPAGIRIEWFTYNAGPSAMEAFFAQSIDLTYVGPSPAINAYARSHGDEVRIVSGAVNGGSALVVQPSEDLHVPGDFRGKRIGTPQLGNTQDVAVRAWLAAGGVHVTQTGGEAQIIPTANPDQLTLFQTKQLDAVWTVEPWVSRLVNDAGGKVLVDDHDAVTTVLVSRAAYLEQQRPLVERFVQAHVALTAWILEHPADAQEMVRAELAAETHGAVSAALVSQSWQHLTPTTTVSLQSLNHFVSDAQAAGFMRSVPDLGRLLVTL